MAAPVDTAASPDDHRSALGPPGCDGEPDDGHVDDRALLEGPIFRPDINHVLDLHGRLTNPSRPTITIKQAVDEFNHDFPTLRLTEDWAKDRLTSAGDMTGGKNRGAALLKDRVRHEDAVVRSRLHRLPLHLTDHLFDALIERVKRPGEQDLGPQALSELLPKPLFDILCKNSRPADVRGLVPLLGPKQATRLQAALTVACRDPQIMKRLATLQALLDSLPADFREQAGPVLQAHSLMIDQGLSLQQAAKRVNKPAQWMELRLHANGNLHLASTSAGKVLFNKSRRSAHPQVRSALNHIPKQLPPEQVDQMVVALHEEQQTTVQRRPTRLFDCCVRAGLPRMILEMLFPDPATRTLDPQAFDQLRGKNGARLPQGLPALAAAREHISTTPTLKSVKEGRIYTLRHQKEKTPAQMRCYDLAQLVHVAHEGPAGFAERSKAAGVSGYACQYLFVNGLLDENRLLALPPSQVSQLRAALQGRPSARTLKDLKAFRTDADVRKFQEALYAHVTDPHTDLSLQAHCFNHKVSDDFIRLMIGADFNMNDVALKRFSQSIQLDVEYVQRGNLPLHIADQMEKIAFEVKAFLEGAEGAASDEENSSLAGTPALAADVHNLQTPATPGVQSFLYNTRTPSLDPQTPHADATPGAEATDRALSPTRNHQMMERLTDYLAEKFNYFRHGKVNGVRHGGIDGWEAQLQGLVLDSNGEVYAEAVIASLCDKLDPTDAQFIEQSYRQLK